MLAEGIREAYEDLFRINKDANSLTASQIKGKLKTLLQGSKSESVLQKMTTTFTALCELADFSENATTTEAEEAVIEPEPSNPVASSPPKDHRRHTPTNLQLGYTINVNLPATRDQEVYNSIFRAIRENLS